MTETAAKEMPRYLCHKEVHALKIAQLRILLTGEMTEYEYAEITPEDEDFAPFRVSRDFFLKHNGGEGDYYVVYKDGYRSISPAKAFEEGYTLCSEDS